MVNVCKWYSFTGRALYGQVTSHLVPFNISTRTPRALPRSMGDRGLKQAHWIHIVFPLSVLRGSTVSSPNVEKNCSISFWSMSFLFSASSFARSAFRILISIIVNFFLSWSSSSWRLIISVSKVKFRCSKLQRVREEKEIKWFYSLEMWEELKYFVKAVAAMLRKLGWALLDRWSKVQWLKRCFLLFCFVYYLLKQYSIILTRRPQHLLWENLVIIWEWLNECQHRDLEADVRYHRWQMPEAGQAARLPGVIKREVRCTKRTEKVW